MKILEEKGAQVDYNDPYIERIPKMRKYNLNKNSVSLSPEVLSGYDCVIIATDHSIYDPSLIVEHSKIIIDTRNFIQKNGIYSPKVVKA